MQRARLFTAAFPYEPKDLRPENAPVLVEVRVPRRQTVADVHTPAGISKAGLPATYPGDLDGALGAPARKPLNPPRCCALGVAPRARQARGFHLPTGGRVLLEVLRFDEMPMSEWFPLSSCTVC